MAEALIPQEATDFKAPSQERSNDEVIRGQYDLYLAGINNATTLQELENAVQGLGMYFGTVLGQYPDVEEYNMLYQHLRREYDVKKYGFELDGQKL